MLCSFEQLLTHLGKKSHRTLATLLADQAVGVGSSVSIRYNGARIIFASMAMPEAVCLICEAAKRNLVWPGYVWVFYSRTFQEFINNAVCDLEILLPALENVTLLHIPLQGRDLDDVLVSGHSFNNIYRSLLLLTILLQIQCMMKFGH